MLEPALSLIRHAESAVPMASNKVSKVRAWRVLRARLDHRQQARVAQRRFRQDQEAHLADPEQRLCYLVLPP